MSFLIFCICNSDEPDTEPTVTISHLFRKITEIKPIINDLIDNRVPYNLDLVTVYELDPVVPNLVFEYYSGAGITNDPYLLYNYTERVSFDDGSDYKL